MMNLNAGIVEEINGCADRMYQTAYAVQNVPALMRAETIKTQSAMLGELVLGHGIKDDVKRNIVRAEIIQACAPSLIQIAKGLPSNQEIAGQVYANMHSLIDENSRRGLYGNPPAKLIFRLKELCVAGVIWRGISRGLLPEDSLVHAVDRQTESINGPGKHYNLRARYGGVNPKNSCIKVTNRANRGTGYYGDVVVITPDDLHWDNIGEKTVPLLKALRSDSEAILDFAGNQAGKMLSPKRLAVNV
jgi:hypothetical protein